MPVANDIMMKRVSFLICAVVCVYSASLAQDLVVRGGWLFNVAGGRVVKNQGVWVKAGKIYQIGGLPSTIDAAEIRLSDDDYLLPGFIDLHAHFRVSYQNLAHDDTVAMPKIFLANGITTAFPAGEIEPFKMKELRESIDRGERPGPRILSTGPYYGTAAPDWNQDFTTEDIYQRVDYWAQNGARGFKAKGISAPHLKALIDRAHQHGLTVTAHLNSGYRGSVNPQQAIEMGIDRVEHFLGGELLADSIDAYQSLKRLDPFDPRLGKIIGMYIEHGVYFDATVGTYGAIGDVKEDAFDGWVDERQFFTPFTRKLTEDQATKPSDFSKLCAQIYPVKKAVLRRYYEAGGKVSVGTDRPLLLDNFLGYGIGGFFIHRELHVMVSAGITNAEVLKMVTLQNAQAMGLGDQLGSIEVGKLADMIVIKGNPLSDIRNTRSVHTVIKGGVVFDSGSLLQRAVGKLGPVSEESWKAEQGR